MDTPTGGNKDNQPESETEPLEPLDSQGETITFVLKAVTDEWRGYYPARIYDAVNPDLDVPPWEFYSPEPREILLENGDGLQHGLMIEGENGELLTGSDVVSNQGERVSVSYKPNFDEGPMPIAGRAQYYCPFHPDTEQGTLTYWTRWEFTPSSIGVMFEDQKSDGTSVVVSEVSSRILGGFIGIYEGERFEDIDRDSREGAGEAVNAYESKESNQLGMSDLLHKGVHSDVEIQLQPPLENGEHTLVAIVHPSSPDGEIGSPKYSAATGNGPFINWHRTMVSVV